MTTLLSLLIFTYYIDLTSKPNLSSHFLFVLLSNKFNLKRLITFTFDKLICLITLIKL